jgi:hypothetical protein
MEVAVHLKVRDRVKVLDALRAVLEREGLVRADAEHPDAVRVLVAPTQGEWTTLYPEQTDQARGLARAVAAELEAPALVVGMIGEEALFYSAYDDEGEPVDDYHSCPDYEKEFGDDDASQEELDRTKGDIDQVLQLLDATVTGRDLLAQALAEARVERLVDLDPWQTRPDLREVLRRLRDALKLPPLVDYEEMALEAEESGEVRLLAFRRPKADKGLKLPKLPRLPFGRRGE